MAITITCCVSIEFGRSHKGYFMSRANFCIESRTGSLCGSISEFQDKKLLRSFISCDSLHYSHLCDICFSLNWSAESKVTMKGCELSLRTKVEGFSCQKFRYGRAFAARIWPETVVILFWVIIPEVLISIIVEISCKDVVAPSISDLSGRNSVYCNTPAVLNSGECHCFLVPKYLQEASCHKSRLIESGWTCSRSILRPLFRPTSIIPVMQFITAHVSFLPYLRKK